MLALPLGTFEAIECKGNRAEPRLLVDKARLPDIFITLIPVGKIDILVLFDLLLSVLLIRPWHRPEAKIDFKSIFQRLTSPKISDLLKSNKIFIFSHATELSIYCSVESSHSAYLC